MAEGTGEIPKQPIKPNLNRETVPQKNSLISKIKHLFAAGAITATGAAVETTAHPIENIVDTAKSAPANLAEAGSEGLKDLREREGYRDIYGKYLDVDQNGNLFITEEPKVITVKYVPQTDPNSPSQTDIVIRRRPEVVLGPEERINPKDIQSSYAVRVAGGTFAESGIGRFKVVYNGQEYWAGEWLMPVNDKGEAIDPETRTVIPEEEDKYYIAGSFGEIDTPPAGTDPNPAKW
jgi:hypothetical protein